MYKIISDRLTNFFVNKKIISEENSSIYSYGFEILLSTFIYVLIFIASALLTSTLITSVLFFVGFFFVRKFCGGYHASTYTKCHLITALTHFCAIAIILFFPESFRQLFSTVSLLLSSILIICFAPVDHKNKPFIKNEYKRFKKKSRIYASIIVLIIIANTIPNKHIQYFIFPYSIGSLTATLSMLVEKIRKTQERRYQK